MLILIKVINLIQILSIFVSFLIFTSRNIIYRNSSSYFNKKKTLYKLKFVIGAAVYNKSYTLILYSFSFSFQTW